MSLALKKSKEKLFLSSEKKAKKKIKKGIINVHHPVKKSNYEERGVVYLGHIPHGFYEEQIKKYFSQFGKITRLRLARSRKTGRSKGYAFIEFQFAEVAKVAAETMNNYLMFKRLLKAQYISYEESKKNFFCGQNWTSNNYPGLTERKKAIKQINKLRSEKQEQVLYKRALSKVTKVNAMFKDIGVEYNFKPVEIPLLHNIERESINKNQSIKNKLVNYNSDNERKVFDDDIPSLDSDSDFEDLSVDSDEGDNVNFDDNGKKMSGGNTSSLDSGSNLEDSSVDNDEEGEGVKTPNIKKRFNKLQFSTSVEGKPENVKAILSVNKKLSMKKKKTGGIVKKSKTVTKVPKKEQEKVKNIVGKILKSDNVIVKTGKIGKKSKNNV